MMSVRLAGIIYWSTWVKAVLRTMDKRHLSRLTGFAREAKKSSFTALNVQYQAAWLLTRIKLKMHRLFTLYYKFWNEGTSQWRT